MIYTSNSIWEKVHFRAIINFTICTVLGKTVILFAYISLSLAYSSRKNDTDSSLLGRTALPQTHAVHYFVMYAEHDTI